ncbi:MAG: outer membrane protein assembly factor BamC [Methylococcales symbiont of Iophon sp. n. MRB-2018]|nr:MAG: outer membrane protein assembly factor BamC [Methylococcales symbiont of Iophon sp. n. MRB-2018]KAF3979740.1 MAG: outer membrane protein assembly factor BamC [Methylococcales symbiont of Iophon sp. n. MRB-2018]
MYFIISKCFTIVLLVLTVSACSKVKNYFPDKSKEYQLSTEIAALNIPSEFENKEHTFVELEMPRGTEIITDKTKEEASIYIELVQYSEGSTRIRINDNMEKTWRTVGKSLRRNFIEIIDRNEQKRVYSVLYDAIFEKVKDDSLWDKVLFIFASDPVQEEEFKIKLIEYNGFIEAIVLNKNNIPLSDGNGLKLLELLYQTIKQDLAK